MVLPAHLCPREAGRVLVGGGEFSPSRLHPCPTLSLPLPTVAHLLGNSANSCGHLQNRKKLCWGKWEEMQPTVTRREKSLLKDPEFGSPPPNSWPPAMGCLWF